MSTGQKVFFVFGCFSFGALVGHIVGKLVVVPLVIALLTKGQS